MFLIPKCLFKNKTSIGLKTITTRVLSDVAQSDFFLFGFIKNSLKGQKFTLLDDIKEKIIEICNSISKATIKSIFSSWIKRYK